jgi:hypothetical protein
VPFVDGSGELVVFGPADDEDTSYVMNLLTTGGFLDGRRLDEVIQTGGTANPLAVGHRVNHPARGSLPNVRVVPFLWADVADACDGDGGDSWSAASALAGDGAHYPVPNARRHDGTPWYFCPLACEVARHPTARQEGVGLLAGALVVTSAPVATGGELFLDYALRGPPHPAWANGWYSPVEVSRPGAAGF